MVVDATTANAAPFRDGANHHLGDDSFVVAFGRAPDRGDAEKLRMHTHLVYVRDRLRARRATRPALEGRRAELLGYLDEYIANGVTPTNRHLPWRTPVFIDDDGAICAVGYLIERSAGRSVAERIAREHRYDFLEVIAAAMPGVRAWIAASGFTLDELASIQPAYAYPNHETWRTWDLVRHAPADGPYEDARNTGAFHRRSMHGAWTRKSADGVVIGEGTLDHGAGTWKSYHADGKRVLATGPYVRNKAHGTWRIYHPSGNLAAIGPILDGARSGRWTFYYDTPDRTPILEQRFAPNGDTYGDYRVFDTAGKVLATRHRSGVVDVVADEHGITQRLASIWHALDFNDGRDHRLLRLARRGETLFVYHSGYAENVAMYDAQGALLARSEDGWYARDCAWPAKRKRIAKADNVAWLVAVLATESRRRAGVVKQSFGTSVTGDPGPACGAPKLVDTARSTRLDALLAARTKVRSPTPRFVASLADGKGGITDGNEGDGSIFGEERLPAIPFFFADHVDQRFEQVFDAMSGRYKWLWFTLTELEADGSDPNENWRTDPGWPQPMM